MDFERAFVAAGGLLIAGLDPTGNGGVVAGFGDLREVELLVEAGFTPMESLQTATSNPAKFLGRESSFGSVAPGKVADLVLLTANPLENIRNTQKISAVIAKGRFFDPAALDAMLRQVEQTAKGK